MSASTARISRSVVKSVLSRETPEGAGAIVRRSIGTPQMRHFTPFLMLDHFAIDEGAGFPDHPHRGMTTLSYMLTGEFQHEDIKGHKGHIRAGDVQFMIAGKGIVHSEMPVHRPGLAAPTGLQLWIDLPKQHKLVEASYQELTAAEIPAAHPSEGVTIKVVCGETDGSESEGVVISPVRPLGGCWFLDVQLKNKGDEVFQRIPKGWNTFVYQLEGDINYGDDAASLPIAKYHTSVFSNEDDQEGIRIKAASEGGARVVVVAGEPLDQEIVQHGPFVMDSRAGIQQAFMDYQMGRNGFEGAHGWRSEIGKSMT